MQFTMQFAYPGLLVRNEEVVGSNPISSTKITEEKLQHIS